MRISEADSMNLDGTFNFFVNSTTENVKNNEKTTSAPGNPPNQIAPPQQTRKKKKPFTKSLGIAPPQTPDTSMVFQLLYSLTPDGLAIITSLLEIPSNNQIDQIQNIISYLPRVFSHPAHNSYGLFPAFIDSIRIKSDFYKRIMNPPVSIVFSKSQKNIPVFRTLPMVPNTQLTIPIRHILDEKSLVVGSVLSFTEISPNCHPISMNQLDIYPLYYGDSCNHYILSTKSHPDEITITFTSPVTHLFQWFVVQSVEMKNPNDIKKLLYSSQKKLKNISHSLISVKTIKCKECHFDPLPVIEQILKNGGAK